MKRWSRNVRAKVDAPRVEAFLAEIDAVCRKFGFVIEHEDRQGSFLIERRGNPDWLQSAAIGETVDEGEA